MDFQDFEAQLNDWQAGMGAAEFHGSLVGYLLSAGHTDARVLADALALEEMSEALSNDAHARAEANALIDATLRDLHTADFEFEPLLPGTDASVGARASALGEWVRGFLAGLAMSGKFKQARFDAETKELVDDLSRIAGSEIEAPDDDSGEADLMELCEFVRMGVLYLRDELKAAVEPGSGTRH